MADSLFDDADLTTVKWRLPFYLVMTNLVQPDPRIEVWDRCELAELKNLWRRASTAESLANWQVWHHSGDASELAPGPPPFGLPQGGVFRLCGVRFSTSATLLPTESIGFTAMELGDDDLERCLEALDSGYSLGEPHSRRLLGRPWPIQKDPRATSQLATHSVYDGKAGETRARLREKAADWQLLLQLSSAAASSSEGWRPKQASATGTHVGRHPTSFA